MMKLVNEFLARQFSKPSRVIGPLVLAPLWNSRNQALNDSALNLLTLEPDDNVLEIGFGGGYLLGKALARVTRGTVAGIDASAAMTDYCRGRYRRELLAGRLELQCAAVDAIPYATGRFDKVFSVNSLFYWPDAAQAIRECWRVTRDGGALALVFTSSWSLKTRSFAQHGLALRDGPEISRMMREVGFGVSRVAEEHDRHRSYWCVVGTKAAGPA